MSALGELRFAWCVLGGVAAGVAILQVPGSLPFALLPWVLGLVLLLGPTADRVHAGVRELFGGAAGRAAVIALLALALLASALTSPGLALMGGCWLAAIGLVVGAAVGPVRFRELCINLTLSGVVVAACAGAMEAALRLPVLARRYGTPQERARWERAYDHLEDGNAFHLRSRHASIPRRPSVRRILAVGDSFTWGDKISSTDSLWPTLLEQELLVASPGLSTEVVNLSQRGWNTAQEVAALNRIGWQFEPDRVIVQFYANDAEPSGDEPARVGPRIRAGRPERETIEWSALLWVVKRFATGYLSKTSVYDTFERSFGDDAPGWQKMRAALRELGDSATARGVKVTFVLFPDFARGNWTPDTYPLAGIYGRVAAEARTDGFDVVDLIPVFAAEGGDWHRWWATEYDGHPSPAAQGVAAHAIADHLRAEGWPGP